MLNDPMLNGIFRPLLKHLLLKDLLNLRLCSKKLKKLIFDYAFLFDDNIIEINDHEEGLILLHIFKNVKLRINDNFDHIITKNNICNLTELDLRHNYIISDDHICNLTNLKNLNLYFNKLITDNGIKKLKNLKKLTLTGICKITDDGLKNLTNLEDLDLSFFFDDIGKITDNSLKHLTNLTTLRLFENDKITNEGIKKLTKLKKLILIDKSNITDDGIKNLVNLTSLRIGGYNNVIENGLSRTKFLIANNEIKNLKNLKNLTELDITLNYDITGDEIMNFPNLKKIYDAMGKNLKCNTKEAANNFYWRNIEWVYSMMK